MIKTDLGSTAYLSLASSRATRIGEPLFTIGFPVLGSAPSLTEGLVSALSGLGSEVSYLQITAPMPPGHSRGPLVNLQGQLVGLVSTSVDDLAFPAATGTALQNMSYAVKADYARPLFEQPAPRPAAVTRMEAYERARGAACRIEVDR